MRRDDYKQMIPIHGNSPEDFAEKFNKAQRNLAGRHTDIVYDFAHGHVAYLVYEETIETPETLRDEYEKRGESHTCAECPFLERNFDGRVRWHPCRMGRTTLDNAACDYLYKKIEKGEVKL